MATFNDWMSALNGILWHNSVLYVVLATGVLFTIWSRFCQIKALTHGWKVIRGQYDDPDDPGAINHFQALSAALSATVGLGNIGGVALAIALGGPGAVFWMWVVGVVGMALKLTEVTLAMLYRNTDDPDNPHGGPMWVAKQGHRALEPEAAPGSARSSGGIFCITLLISTITGGNMFQAWNVAELTESYFGIPGVFTGIVLAILVGLVIIGGIKRIGAVAGQAGAGDVALYILGGLYVLVVHIDAPAGHALADRQERLRTRRGGRRLHRRHRGLRVPVRHEARAVLERSGPGLVAHRALRGEDGRARSRGGRRRTRAVHRHPDRLHLHGAGHPVDGCLEPRARRDLCRACRR